MFTLQGTDQCTRAEAQELLDNLYQEVLNQENHELPIQERIQVARRRYQNCLEWYTETLNVNGFTDTTHHRH